VIAGVSQRRTAAVGRRRKERLARILELHDAAHERDTLRHGEAAIFLSVNGGEMIGELG